MTLQDHLRNSNIARPAFENTMLAVEYDYCDVASLEEVEVDSDALMSALDSFDKYFANA